MSSTSSPPSRSPTKPSPSQPRTSPGSGPCITRPRRLRRRRNRRRRCARSLPPLASAVRAIESWRRSARQRARVLRVGIAAVLVGAGFILGRLTAPTPSVTSPPVAAEPPMAAKASPVEAPLRGGNAAPPAPIETTATASTAGVAPPSAPHDPVEAVGTAPASTNGPGTARPALAHTSAPDMPLHAGTAVRTAPPRRSERVEPAEVTPPAPADQLNPFVQAIQDDIKEDEAAAGKNRAVSPQ